MQVPFIVGAAVGGLLVESHGIGESGLKQIVVTNSDAAQDVAEEIALFRAELIHRSDVALAQDARFLRGHSRNCEIVAGSKTHHAADSLLCLSHQQASRIKLDRRDLRQHRGVIVFKNVGFLILRCLCSARAPVSWAQIAIRIETDSWRLLKLLHSSLPRTLRPMGRDENPLAQERIEAPVWNSI